MLKVIQLTDTHLFAEADQTLLGCVTLDTMNAVVDVIAERWADLLLLTGDLSQDGSAASYEALFDALGPLGIPCFAVPGNHDGPQLQTILNKPPFSTEQIVQRAGWQFIFLDTQVPGATHGELRPVALNDLRELLGDGPSLSTMLVMHHPPFRVGSGWLNEIGLRNTPEFYDVIDAFPQVRLVLSGHVHMDFHSERNGVHYYSSPSTCIQFAPDSDRFALDAAYPGFRELELREDGSFSTTIRRVPVRMELDLQTMGY